MSFIQLIKVGVLIFICNSIAYASTSMKDVFLQHNDHASDKWENYFDIYDRHINQYVGSEAVALEIGVQNGGSLQVLDKYLVNGMIYGVDIVPEVCKLDLGKNIKLFCQDINSQGELSKNLGSTKFDIIIDDASHMQDDIINTFSNLFDSLKPGGVYFIEDVHTSYWKSHQGSYKGINTSVEFFKELVDYLNYFHIREDNANPEIQIDLLKKDFAQKYAPWIESIVFYDGVIVITKLKKPKNTPYARMVVGSKQPICPAIDIAKKENYFVGKNN